MRRAIKSMALKKQIRTPLLFIAAAVLFLTGCGAQNTAAAGIILEQAPGVRMQAEAEQAAAGFSAYFEETCGGSDAAGFFADLTHDGIDELIVAQRNSDDGFTSAQVSVLVWNDGAPSVIYQKQMDESHTGWGWLYLYEENGEAYLFDYDPVLYEGDSRYTYTLFSLTESGQQVPGETESISFQWTGQPGQADLEAQLKAFNEKALAYMNQAQVIAAIGEEYFSGISAMDFGAGDL